MAEEPGRLQSRVAKSRTRLKRMSTPTAFLHPPNPELCLLFSPQDGWVLSSVGGCGRDGEGESLTLAANSCPPPPLTHPLPTASRCGQGHSEQPDPKSMRPEGPPQGYGTCKTSTQDPPWLSALPVMSFRCLIMDPSDHLTSLECPGRKCHPLACH